MTPGTLANYRSLWDRFVAYRQANPGPLRTQAGDWLLTLPLSQIRIGRQALRHSLGEDALPWRVMGRGRPYHRNVLRLRETILEPEEVERLRGAADCRERAFMECLWTLRRMEACRLHWYDVNFADRVFRVEHGKGDKAAPTVMIVEADQALRQWWSTSGYPAQDAYVFPSRRGDCLGPHSGAAKLIHALFVRTGTDRPGRGCHSFRRTFASRYLQTYPDRLSVLQSILRHSNLHTTTLYLYPDLADLKRGLDAVRL